ncbi:MAG: OmpW family outer membrane protein [Acidobacteriota bacterium]
MKTTRTILSVLVASAASFLLCASTSQAAEGDWRVHLGLWTVSPDLDLIGDDGARVESDDGGGLRLGVSRQIHRRWSVAAEIGLATPELQATLPMDGGSVRLGNDLNTLPITVGLDWHLTPAKRFDLFLGARLAYVHYGSFTLQQALLGRQEFDTDDELGWSVLAGLDVPFGTGPWSLLAVLGYLDADVLFYHRGAGALATLELDPTYVSVGVGYRF